MDVPVKKKNYALKYRKEWESLKPKDSKTAKKIRRLEKRLERYKKKENIENSDPCEVLEDPPNQVNDPDVLSFVEDNTESPSDLDPDLLEALEEPSISQTDYGDEIHPQILARINNILTEGLAKEERDKIIKSQLIPINGKLMEAPRLNVELAGVLSGPSKTRDSLLFNRQQDLGLAIAVKSHQTMKRASNALRPRPALTGGTNSNRTSQSGPRNFQSPLRRNQYQGHPGRGHRRGQYPRRQQFRPLNQDKAAAPASRGRARYP
ncbi:hypothetical protein ACJJTC_019544 [Scirpophaga incertulas]